jgi:hypothetical protein
MVRDLMDSMPLWGALLITIGLVLVTNEVGFRLGVLRSESQEKAGHTQVLSMTGAHLGLLAFILAFSFSMSAGHFSERKHLLLEEYNAIETAYLRAGLVADPQGSNIRSLLARYTAARTTPASQDTIAEVIRQSEALQQDIWNEVKQLPKKEKVTVMDSLLIQSVNTVFDLHEKRVFAGLHNRIPTNIWAALYVILILSMVGMGFSAGLAKKRNPIASFALGMSFSMVMFVIADLDRPISGLMRADQTMMVSLAQRLQDAQDGSSQY